jgi:hypothetical protein
MLYLTGSSKKKKKASGMTNDFLAGMVDSSCIVFADSWLSFYYYTLKYDDASWIKINNISRINPKETLW